MLRVLFRKITVSKPGRSFFFVQFDVGLTACPCRKALPAISNLLSEYVFAEITQTAACQVTNVHASMPALCQPLADSCVTENQLLHQRLNGLPGPTVLA